MGVGDVEGVNIYLRGRTLANKNKSFPWGQYCSGHLVLINRGRGGTKGVNGGSGGTGTAGSTHCPPVGAWGKAPSDLKYVSDSTLHGGGRKSSSPPAGGAVAASGGGVDFVRCCADATGTPGCVVCCLANECCTPPYRIAAAAFAACWVSAATTAASTTCWVSAATASVERSGVYVDYLPPSPPARVDLKGVQEDGFLPPSLPVELGNNVRSMNTSPTVGQYVDPTVSPPPPLPLAPSRTEWRG